MAEAFFLFLWLAGLFLVWMPAPPSDVNASPSPTPGPATSAGPSPRWTR